MNTTDPSQQPMDLPTPASPTDSGTEPVKIERICYCCSKCGLVAAYEEQPCPLCASRADHERTRGELAGAREELATWQDKFYQYEAVILSADRCAAYHGFARKGDKPGDELQPNIRDMGHAIHLLKEDLATALRDLGVAKQERDEAREMLEDRHRAIELLQQAIEAAIADKDAAERARKELQWAYDDLIADVDRRIERAVKQAEQRATEEAERGNALANCLRKLNSQAGEVHRYSSWISMCEYLETADARDDAAAALQAHAAARAAVKPKPKPDTTEYLEGLNERRP